MEKLYSSKTCLKMANGGDAFPTSPAWICPCLLRKPQSDRFYTSVVGNLFRTADRFETELFLRTGL